MLLLREGRLLRGLSRGGLALASVLKLALHKCIPLSVWNFAVRHCRLVAFGGRETIFLATELFAVGEVIRFVRIHVSVSFRDALVGLNGVKLVVDFVVNLTEVQIRRLHFVFELVGMTMVETGRQLHHVVSALSDFNVDFHLADCVVRSIFGNVVFVVKVLILVQVFLVVVFIAVRSILIIVRQRLAIEVFCRVVIHELALGWDHVCLVALVLVMPIETVLMVPVSEVLTVETLATGVVVVFAVVKFA